MNDQNHNAPAVIDAPMGFILGESAASYHGTRAVSASKLRVFARVPGGPQLYYQRFVAKTIEDEDSKARLEGRALHSLALEGPEKFAQDFVMVPESAPPRPTQKQLTAKKPAPATVEAIQWWADFNAANTGKEVITAEMFANVARWAEAIHAHPLAPLLFARGRPETTWRVNAPGLPNLPPLQCRPDWFNESGCELTDGRAYDVDIKTTATLDELEFGNWQRGFEQHRYHQQAALYMAIQDLLGVAVRDFVFVAVEKCPPYGVKIGLLNERALAQGQDEVERLLVRLDGCYLGNRWPNSPLGLLDFNLSPRYYARASEQAGGEL